MAHVDEIHFVHHCHTDIGYTHDQSTLWDLQRRFIDEAVSMAAEDRDVDEPHAFRWTVETTAPLLWWLASASEEEIRRFQELEAEGRIEVTGMLANITPLYGPAQLAEMLRPIRHLRKEYGFEIRHAMNCDVNGQNWPLVDALVDADIRGFSMAINTHFGGAPLERPMVFNWEGPSGRTLLTLNGYHYSTGWHLGIGHDAKTFREQWWPRIEDQLDQIEYPLPALLIQSFHPFGDNAPPYRAFSSFIESWNEQGAVLDGDLPRIRFATPGDYWDVVHEHVDELPTHRGDWTDFWNFGSASSARETAINRENRRRLITADALEACLAAADDARGDNPGPRQADEGTRDEAWWNLQFYDEHTWGADTSINAPEGTDARSQWNHKANYAYRGRSLSQLLQRDSVAELARMVPTEGGDSE